MHKRLGVEDSDLEIADAISRFAQSELAPRAAQVDRDELSTTRYVAQLAALGVMGMNLPERWGGVDASAVAIVLSLVEIAKACASTSSMIGAHYLATDSILIGGDDTLRERYLRDAASGRKLGAFALTEPRAGSNPADMSTRATREGDGYRITGVKHFISNADAAGFIVVYAKTDTDAGTRGISAFVVDRETPGVDVAPAEKLMGIRGAPAHEVALDCHVPAANRLGTEGSGFRTAMKVLDNSRLDVAATSIGIAEAALALAVDWLKTRHVGGEPLSHKQGLQWTIADMKTRLEAAWLLTLQAAAMRGAGEPFTQHASMAKLYASEMAAFVADAALQLHGGYGFTREMPLERLVRDARILRIYEGSSEIQRTVIARSVLA
ncbi:ACYL COA DEHYDROGENASE OXIDOREDUCTASE PROTEIN; putative Butyryl-CoA dehydrogenase [Paraburkholderia piptadeniae]|uniref:3-sulfinopropanoyl-CoA desulfinase n=1 Tax=Paraburkholderia piptadeniae TaxID=1701573 RepID=A0A1N7SNM1_9BURK|nr:acyl-CoA dehydrogenase family protein [Paraburkholderia piptadeniae]SIT48531.1 ACYL COA DEHYDROGENASE OXIDOREDUCTASE PROTEIN; putative Butyryl-CoA dehydrogenase [Paraburkholderia piptadeniae]